MPSISAKRKLIMRLTELLDDENIPYHLCHPGAGTSTITVDDDHSLDLAENFLEAHRE